MKHEQCASCKNCAWVAKFYGKWLCECMRPKFWGKVDEDNKDCEFYQFCSWTKDEYTEEELWDQW